MFSMGAFSLGLVIMGKDQLSLNSVILIHVLKRLTFSSRS
jgi:hypothetical protein